MSVNKIVLFFLIHVSFLPGFFQAVAIDTCFADGSSAVDLEKCLHVLEDEHRVLNIEDILEGKATFVNEKDGNLNFGFTNSSFWIKFIIKHTGMQPKDYYVQVKNPDINELKFYELVNGQLKKEVQTGENYKFSSRGNSNRNFVFKLNLEPGVSHTVIIQCYNNGDALFVPLTVQPEKVFFQGEYRDMLIHGAFYGITLLILLLNLYLFKSLRDKIYFYYVFYAFFVFLFVLNLDGLFFKYFIPESPWFSNHITPVFPTISIIFLTRISDLFLQASKHPVAKRYLITMEIMAYVVIVLSFFDGKLFIAGVVGALIVYSLTFSGVYFFSFVLFKKRAIPLRLFSSAFLFMLIATIIYFLRDAGIIPHSLFAENIGRIGLFGQSTLLLLAVIARFRLQQDESRKVLQERNEEIETQKESLVLINAELEKLSIVASEVENSVAIYHVDGDLEWCNRAFEKLYGMDLKNIKRKVGSSIKDIISHPGINDIIEEALEEREPVIFDNEMVDYRGRQVWLQTTLTPFMNDKNKILKLITIASDITQLKNYEFELIEAKEKAEESDRLKTTFLSNMSHEIRTPLNAILGFSELLKDNQDFPISKQKQYIHIIQDNGKHLLQLISDIIDISRLEAGELKLTPTRGNLNQTMDELYSYFSSEIKDRLKKPIELNYVKGENDDKALIITDHQRVKQVLSNLISNAIKFTKEGSVEIGYDLKGNQVEFHVKDTGIGIPAEKKDIIFQRFSQIESGLTRQYEGAGMGLYLAKGMVHKLEGNLWYISTEGEGSVFYFSIPVVRVLPVKDSIPQGKVPAYRWEGKKFLLVEDTVDVRMYFDELMQYTGAILEKASTGRKALEMVKESDYDLVLMDIRLPDINGFDVTRKIREFNHRLPIIAQTAIAIDSEKERCLESGCDDYISKPIKGNELLFKIEKLLYHP